MELFTLILSACSNAYFMSYNLSATDEIIQGGATNRIWVFVRQFFLLRICFSPLSLLLPTASFTIGLAFYSSLTFLGALNYLASICHNNQIKLNGSREGELAKLPFGLHNQPQFSQWIIFLARNITYAIAASYIVGLGALAISGAYFFVGMAAGMLLIDQAYKNGWMPRLLQKPYSFATTFLLLNVFFSNAFAITLMLANVSILAWDYIQLNVYNVRRGKTQFPSATQTQEKILIPETIQDLKHLLTSGNYHSMKITFDHFEKANTVSNKLLANSPAVDFKQYAILFNKLDFRSKTLRDNLINEMADHDLYSEKSHEEHRRELKLSPDTSISDIQIAWLKREMHYVVRKLISPSYKELSHQAVITMHGQARYLLSFLLNSNVQSVKENILLSLAVRTGQHCNGIYVDTFAELSHHYAFAQASLTTQERVILTAQSIREDQFRKYYYDVFSQLKKSSEGFKLTSQTIDLNDYHTYEGYVALLGSAYYLRNTSMHNNTRTLQFIFVEFCIDYTISQHISDGTLKKGHFSDYYNSDILLHEVLEGKLHPYFMLWCEEKCPGSYQDLVLDPETLCVQTKKPHTIKLAELMLIDLGLVEPIALKNRLINKKTIKASSASEEKNSAILQTNPETLANPTSTLQKLSFLNSIEQNISPVVEEQNGFKMEG